MPDSEDLARYIQSACAALGFDLAGITQPTPVAHHDTYRAWVSAGRHGTMAYLGTERAVAARSDPRQVLPECRSILIVAANYTPSPQAEHAPWQLDIAGYAQGEDYHRVLTRRLRRVMAELEAHLGRPIRHRLYTDTGPLLERELAQQAGLGWIGRNTCLIHPRLGSYLFLAEVLLELDLPADPPFTSDHCGACTRCVQACPTGCILPDRTLDARRCISYLTIELRGRIPVDLRQAIGGWVFGCDICQQVCPWNLRFASPTNAPEFQPRPWLRSLRANDLLRLTATEFEDGLRHSPLKRARRTGLLRNAAIAAANMKDPGTPAAMRALLEAESDSDLREALDWALAQFPGEGS
jgi:epoxyqueuosine reductase